MHGIGHWTLGFPAVLGLVWCIAIVWGLGNFIYDYRPPKIREYLYKCLILNVW